ncbi:MAG: hypothetical protein JKY56_25030 [Kofleriaceae bacterium]|nr:hypothetical protein [Kofleriaceae bacterium]
MPSSSSQIPVPSSTLARLGLATPPPFVGRMSELAELKSALSGSPLLVINGAVGSGKTRLAGRLSEQLANEFQVTHVDCAPGDLGVAVIARCERAMDRRPGCLQQVIESEAQLLIIDDVHHLGAKDIQTLVEALVSRPGVGRLLLLSREILPLARDDARQFSITLEGLEESGSRDLWQHLEALYGPSPDGAFEKALALTRGMPLAMRREYSRSRYGESAWELDALSAETRAALEAICVVRVAAAPAAVAALLGLRDVESALIDLVSRQLIDPLRNRRFSVHDVVRDQVLDAMLNERREHLELQAVELVRGMGKGVSAKRPAWTAGDDGAIALLDEVDRCREIVMHLIAAGKLELATDELSAIAERALARGAGGELLSQIEFLRSLGVNNQSIRNVSALVAVRHGQVAKALDLSDSLHPVLFAFLLFRAGDCNTARDQLNGLLDVESLDSRAAAAALAELEPTCGRSDIAESAIAGAFEMRAGLSSTSRANLHLAFAEVESHRNNLLGARAALARAASAAEDTELCARVLVRQLRNLLDEGRYSEAANFRPQVESAIAEVDSIPLRDELVRCDAIRYLRIGNSQVASDILRDIVASARSRGDEVSALRAELDLALVLLEACDLRQTSEIVAATTRTASQSGLHALVAQASVILAGVLLKELRLESAQDALDSADRSMLPFAYQLLSKTQEEEIAAWQGNVNVDASVPALQQATLAMAAGKSAVALQEAQCAAIDAERLQNISGTAKAMAIVARLELARGDRQAAQIAASRAARESLASGCNRSQIHAFLVLSALSREEGDLRQAATYARDARTIACTCGLPVETLATSQALEVIAGGESVPEGITTARTATASEKSLHAAEALLGDLGFSAVRPYRCVNAAGVESYVASASPELLGMNQRSLAVDSVRQVIIRNGETVADLRRRSLLKRLLFLFSAGPTKIFSKEDIVEKVWEVEYHPLRHDAALFTNIMRIRRLLGEDGIDLIQVSEDGYALMPPKDFLFVEEVT